MTEPTTAEAPAPPEAPATPEATPGPWSSDLETTFTDEATRAQVDTFLRGHVQPHVTRVEQEAAALKQAGDLVRDLQQHGPETFLALAEEMWGPEAAQQVRGTLTSVYGEAAPEPTPAAPEAAAAPEAPAAPQLPPEVQELLAERQAAKNLESYNAEVAKIVAKDATVVESEFHPFVVSAEGDMEAAHTAYKQWQGEVQARYAPADPNAPAPEALGSDTVGTTTPPIRPTYNSLDEAMDDFFTEQKTGAPAPVGSV